MKVDVNALLKLGKKYGPAIVMGIMTIAGGIADKNREDEFEAMKKTLSELKNK